MEKRMTDANESKERNFLRLKSSVETWQTLTTYQYMYQINFYYLCECIDYAHYLNLGCRHIWHVDILQLECYVKFLKYYAGLKLTISDSLSF